MWRAKEHSPRLVLSLWEDPCRTRATVCILGLVIHILRMGLLIPPKGDKKCELWIKNSFIFIHRFHQHLTIWSVATSLSKTAMQSLFIPLYCSPCIKQMLLNRWMQNRKAFCKEQGITDTNTYRYTNVRPMFHQTAIPKGKQKLQLHTLPTLLQLLTSVNPPVILKTTSTESLGNSHF